MGRLFLTDHLLAFEITSIVLLVAAVGGVVLGMRSEAEARGRRGGGRVVLGPGVPWYLAISAMLFSIGVAGVLLRRSPLIVLLSLEIMLNAANLAFVGFSRLFGEMDGQVFALAVMAVAAVRGVRRARPDRRDGAPQPRARRRPASRSSGASDDLSAPGSACSRRSPGSSRSRSRARASRGGRPAGSRPGRCSSASPARSSRSSTRWGRDAEERVELTTAWTWLKAGEFEVGLELLVDPLSLVMMLVVTGVGGLIVLYSNGYMAGDDEERRYFAYMAFFVFSMLLLVQGGNLLLLLVGWGLVGLASYLLIGFHHERTSAVAAAKKAFVINALGDAIMALGFFLADRARREPRLRARCSRRPSRASSPTPSSTLVALGLLGGAVAKSAQIPFHTWLPDAMEGPTPGLGADPRGDDGDRRRLPHLPHAPGLRGGARRPAPRRDPRARRRSSSRASSRSSSGTSSA